MGQSEGTRTSAEASDKIQAADPRAGRQASSEGVVRTSKRQGARALKSLEEVILLYREEGRLPSGNARSARERALRSWLSRRRRESEGGTLAAVYQEGLKEIPGWDAPASQKERYEAAWEKRLEELTAYHAKCARWPLEQGAESGEERGLGAWLRYQRNNYRTGALRPDREARLDAALPGWRNTTT